MTDQLQKFLFEGAPVRGEMVELSQTWQQILSHRVYPAPIQALLGQMVAAAALLSANLKFNGVLVMQIHGDGPVKLLVVECDAELHLRATAKLRDDTVIADDATLPELVNVGGHGRFVITLDPKEKLPGQQAYQGIVPLDGETISTVIENYMLRSEQLDTRLWLAADNQVSRGLLLQKLPSTETDESGQAGEGVELDTWSRSVMLASTLKDEELLATDSATLIRRLFWEETIRVLEPKHPQFRCSCHREKVGNMLKMLGQREIDEAIAELGKLEVDCDFCGKRYEFDKVDCAQLFAVEAPVATLLPASEKRH